MVSSGGGRGVGGCVGWVFGLLLGGGRGRVGVVGGVVCVCVVVLVGCAFGAVEPPEVVVEDSPGVVGSPSTEAVFRGVLNPGGAGEAGTYEFLYNASKTGVCTGGSETAEGLAPGSEAREEQSQTIAGLTPDIEYAVCVRVENNAKTESSTSPAVSFVTFPEAPGSEEANPVGDYTATLKGVLAPGATGTGETGSYEFVYRQSTSECVGGERFEDKSAPVPAGTAAGAAAEAVEASITGLSSGTQYTFCLLERNAGGETLGSPFTFTTGGVGITNERAATVEASTVTLLASINPDGSSTGYHFEYDTTPYTSTASHGTSITSEGAGTEINIGSGGSPEPVEVHLTGLTPSTTYYYRVVATNEASEKFYGPNKAITTPPPAGSEPRQGCENESRREEQPYGLDLPDCRAYEMVSPTNTNGQDATGYRAAYSARASEAPKGTEPAIAYSSKASYGNPEGALLENQYLSRRTPEGWSTQAVTPRFTAANTEELSGTYPTTYFTPELTVGLAVSTAQLGEAPPLGESFGVYLAQFVDHSYQYVGHTAAKEVPWGASIDLRRVVLTDFSSGSLFESRDNGLEDVPVSATNTGGTVAAGAGSPAFSKVSPIYKDAWHATSEDGSRVYFTTPAYLEESGAKTIGQLFVRVNVGETQSILGGEGECLEPSMGCTIAVSASTRKPEDPVGPQSARYWGASANGERVFFTSNSELTLDAYTGVKDKAANLYEYDLATHELSDLTVDTADVSEGAAVQGVVQISEDGSYVYFVADGKLATGATQGEPNLYVSHNGEAPVFIATLTQRDKTDWLNGGSEEAGPEINTAVVTPNGGQLAFISERDLPTANFPTGYDTHQATVGECETELEDHELESGACREVYLYDSETRSIVCASCNPLGAQPVGPSNIPGVVPASQPYADYRPRAFLADGTLFFNSKDTLVSGSSGGRGNVYEYEGGAVHAISAASGGYESFFLDASPTGENVFFASADRLLPEDPGGNTVVWDAREEGGFPVTVASSGPCESGESCQSLAATPVRVSESGSGTFSGPGNVVSSVVVPVVPVVKPKPRPLSRAQRLSKTLKVCRRDKAKKKRVVCERVARKRFGVKKAKKATNAGIVSSERRAGR
jgi:hypothetical protein